MDLAIIEERKLTQYLLASSHPAGGAKAAFFQRFGFSAAQWQTLRDALHEHSQSARIVAVSETRFGREYTLEGQLTAPDGLKPQVRAIWFVATGEVAPRLVTAYAVPGVER